MSSIEIKNSKVEGRGVFALRDFRKGDVVYSFPRGKIIGASDVSSVSTEEKRYIDKISDDTFEIIEPPARYVNHSCTPNVEEKDRTAYALRKIKKGEEVTVDYDTTSHLEEPFECHCGSQNCREFVEGKK